MTVPEIYEKMSEDIAQLDFVDQPIGEAGEELACQLVSKLSDEAIKDFLADHAEDYSHWLASMESSDTREEREYFIASSWEFELHISYAYHKE
jgi:hypothetical protein